MRLDIKDHTTHHPGESLIGEMEALIGVQLFHYDYRWPGASHVVKDLMNQGFYLELVDDLPEAPGALGYHDVDQEGRPYSRIGVNPSLQHGSDWLTGDYSLVSVVGHEALETVGDPLCNRWVDMDASSMTAVEMCDAVEATGYRHNGADLTNFLLPAWFNPFGEAPFDYLGQLTAPFTMTAGGYMIVRDDGATSQQFAQAMPEWRRTTARSRASLRLAA